MHLDVIIKQSSTATPSVFFPAMSNFWDIEKRHDLEVEGCSESG